MRTSSPHGRSGQHTGRRSGTQIASYIRRHSSPMALRRTGEGATTPRHTATRLSFIDAFGAVLAVGPALHVSPYPPVPAAIFATNGLVGSRRFRLGPPLSQAGRVTMMTIVRGGSSRGCTAPLPAPELLARRAGSPVIVHTHIGPLGGHSALGEWCWVKDLGRPRACQSGHLCPLWEAVSVRICRHRSPPPTRLTPNSPNDHISRNQRLGEDEW